MVQVANDYAKEVEDELPRGSTLEYEGTGIRLTVPCKHGHDEAISFAKRFPADTIRRMLSNKGWQFNGKRATCPVHANSKVKGENVTQRQGLALRRRLVGQAPATTGAGKAFHKPHHARRSRQSFPLCRSGCRDRRPSQRRPERWRSGSA